MELETHFHKIDMATWSMAQQFHYYTQMAPTSYTVNVKIDVTAARAALKAQGKRFFPAYLWAVTTALAGKPEFGLAKRGETLGWWDELTPAYPQFHKDDGTTSLLWTSYSPSFGTFYERYIDDVTAHGGDHGILTAKGIPTENSYIVSCIPWFTFDSFSLHNHGIKDYYLPSFEAGAFVEQDGRTLMPLSITVHHAATDGWHIKLFLDDLSALFSAPEKWLNARA